MSKVNNRDNTNIRHLADYIFHMVKNEDYVAGHAIFNRDNCINHTLPNKILEDGLIIQDDSCGIAFTSRRFNLPYEECLYNLRSFINDTANAIIILCIPKELLFPYESKYFISCSNTSIVLEPTDKLSSDYHDIYGNPTHIALLPSIFILGYFDIQNNEFVENSNYGFKDNCRNANISKSKPYLDKKYEEILKQNQQCLIKKL